MAVVKKWAIFFVSILVAILIADRLSNLVVAVLGISGWVNLVVGFVLYALFFFGILWVIQVVFKVDFFGFSQD